MKAVFVFDSSESQAEQGPTQAYVKYVSIAITLPGKHKPPEGYCDKQ